MPRTLIIVDDDVLLTLELSHMLTEFGFAVLGQARTLADARKLLRVRLPAAALVSAQLANGEDGLSLARDLQACGVRVVLMSIGPVDDWTGHCLTKPFAIKSVRDLLTPYKEPAVAQSWMRGNLSP